MNRRQLAKLGVPTGCLDEPVRAVQAATQRNREKAKQLKPQLKSVLDAPLDYADDPIWGELATALTAPAPPEHEPIECPIWGEEDIDDGAKQQMAQVDCILRRAYFKTRIFPPRKC